MAPPESGADRHATAFGRGDNRIALAQRQAELEPALLLPQPGQRGAGQRVEALAALLATEPPHAVRCAATDRRAVTAMRAPALIAHTPLDCRRYRRARRSAPPAPPQAQGADQPSGRQPPQATPERPGAP